MAKLKERQEFLWLILSEHKLVSTGHCVLILCSALEFYQGSLVKFPTIPSNPCNLQINYGSIKHLYKENENDSAFKICPECITSWPPPHYHPSLSRRLHFLHYWPLQTLPHLLSLLRPRPAFPNPPVCSPTATSKPCKPKSKHLISYPKPSCSSSHLPWVPNGFWLLPKIQHHSPKDRIVL